MKDDEAVEADVVALGLIEDPFITPGPWVVHPYWESLPPGSGVPFYDTPCKPVPVRELCDRSAHGPGPHSFTARNLERISALTHHRLGVRTAVSLLMAGGLANLGIVAVHISRSSSNTAELVGLVAVAAAVVCGVLLILAAVIDTRGRR